jgi:hypothetical protein
MRWDLKPLAGYRVTAANENTHDRLMEKLPGPLILSPVR